MRFLKTTTFLTPLAISLIPTGTIAQVTISTATTSPVRTATASNGSASDISITENGSITVASGSAVTVDSDNDVVNDGAIVVGAANGAVGIDVQAGRTADITNSGSIAVKETFNAADDDANNIADGPIAQAQNRAGIWMRGGLTGNVVNSETIDIDGLNSAGIRLDGTLNGSLSSSGAITVIGDYSTGISAGNITGNVGIDNNITVTGEGARALDLHGDLGGSVRIQAAVGQRSSYVNDNSVTVSLSRSDLRVGAPAVSISGNVAGGIILAKPPADNSTTDTDEDDDGVLDSEEGTGSIQAYGNGPALRIGGTNNITIGALGGTGASLQVDGSILANAYYSNTDATALQIGGQGGTVDMVNGIKITGTVQATTNDSTATAILIDTGANVPVINNSGSIIASISSPGEGATYGIVDRTGTLTTINNNGYITASGSSEDTVAAIDLSANTTGVTINQYSPDDEDEDDEDTVTSQITGAILTGSGNDKILVSDGLILGNANLGAGDDTVALSGDGAYNGTIDFGTGVATMTLTDTSKFTGKTNFHDLGGTITIGGSALYQGSFIGGSNLTVNVNGGTLSTNGVESVSFGTLNVASGGTLKVFIDGEENTASLYNVGVANFASGAKVSAAISSLTNAEGDYVILKAGELNGAPVFSEEATDLPFLFKGSIVVDTVARELTLSITRKTATELGLNRAQSAIYPAIMAAATAATANEDEPDAYVEQSLLQIADSAGLAKQFNDLMPDYAGGNFDMVTRASRMAMRHITNNNTMFDISDVGGWFEVLKFGADKKATDTAGYKASGWGFSGGLERVTSFGNIGASLAWTWGTNKGLGDDGDAIDSETIELGAFWRVSKGPLYAFARVGMGFAKFNSSRTYTGTINETDFTRTATASWDGRHYSGSAGISYQMDVGERISFKPMAIIDYDRLHENGYEEAGAGPAVNLVVDGRTSDSTAATTTLTGIYRFGKRTSDGIPLTIELEGGRRNMLGGALGTTTARFLDGDAFSLTADPLKSRWVGEARLLSGGLDYTWTVSGNVEETAGSPAYAIRFSLGVAF